MEIVNIILTIVNCIITIITIVFAAKSHKYYKKSRALSEHTETNKALIEIEKMLNKLPEALAATTKYRQVKKGFNLERNISEIGKELIDSYNSIHSCIPSILAEQLFSLEKEGAFELYKYLNGYMTGAVLENNQLDPENYALCQCRLMYMQNFLKEEIDKMEEKLK